MEKKRIEVLKTYKLYIAGKFPRTESGRYYAPKDKNGVILANVCLASRKDFRNAVVAARAAFGKWSSLTAYNRSQILYRIGEILEDRKMQFETELVRQGATQKAAGQEVLQAIDRLIYYAGWCDKYQQVAGTINPVASDHFNFSVPEPMGVVTIFADQETSLIGLVSAVAATIAGGNTCIVLASTEKPLSSITFAEVLNDSDVPGGVVNILTGEIGEIISHAGVHMDVNAIVYCGSNKEHIKMLEEKSTSNVKRIRVYDKDWMDQEAQSLYYVTDLQEIKTTWHPIERIGGSAPGY
ncbi:MAG: aldehyde dehydrogenase family protein [Saprospiraceae bacterium]|nr:aldehyde dehydrogenase family protein [Saprospiraceae bacterium]MCB9323255.1 aldehyde dehydrogenase family protein [Lewinellaceae bacterium]